MAALIRCGMVGLVLVGLGSGTLGCKWVLGTSNDEAAGSASASATAAPAQTAPPPTTVAADPAPTATPSAAASAAPDSANPADSSAPAPDRPAPPAVNKPQPGIEPCCNALAAYEHSGRPKPVRNKAARAAGICRGISDTIRSGRSTRAQGLAQIRALMGGGGPPECN